MNVTRVAGDIFRPSPATLIRTADAALLGIRLRDHVRVRPGIHTPAQEWEQLAPWERYLARVHAYALVNPDAVFCLESAAALLGLPLFGHPRHVHTIDVGGTSRAYGDVRVHASTDECDTLTDAGISATGLAETSMALMRVLPPAFGLAVGDAEATTAALIREKQREDRLRRHLAGFARWTMADAVQVAPLRHALLSAGVPLVTPPRTALLRSVAHNPRSL